MKRRILIVGVVLVCLIAGTASIIASAPIDPLGTRTFSEGTSVIPMDGHQAERLEAFGFVHALLRENVMIFRIIQPPDVTLYTDANPAGATYSGGPILVEDPIPPAVKAQFPAVTVHSLTQEFTSTNVFVSNEPTEILIIPGTWGHSEKCLEWMGIPYVMRTKSEVEANPGLIQDYNLVVVDCAGWSRTVPSAVGNTIRDLVSEGGQAIFTCIALENLHAIFPGYVSVVSMGGENLTSYFDVHNVGEFPSQYHGLSPVPIWTKWGGLIVDEALKPEVRIIVDTQDFAGEYRIGGFYFPYGKGVVEGFSFHPVDQEGEACILTASLFGNKFIHSPMPEPLPELTLTPSVKSNPVGTAHTAVLKYTLNGVPEAGAPVEIEVTSGPNAGAKASGHTNLAGEFQLTYTGNGGPGMDVMVGRVLDAPGGSVIHSVSATKTWVEVVRHVTLTPATASNPVGTSHGVTLTYTIDGSPAANAPVRIEVISGPHSGMIATGFTTGAGQFHWSYPGSVIGMDTIVGRVLDAPGGNVIISSSSVTKHWTEAPRQVTVTPSHTSNVVDTSHTITLIYTVGGSPVANAPVRIEVIEGPHAGVFNQGSTNAQGQFQLTYTGTATGTDTILGTVLDAPVIDSSPVTKRWVEVIPVGWPTYPINGVAIMAPWIALGAAVILGAGLLVLRRRRVWR